MPKIFYSWMFKCSTRDVLVRQSGPLLQRTMIGRYLFYSTRPELNTSKEIVESSSIVPQSNVLKPVPKWLKGTWKLPSLTEDGNFAVDSLDQEEQQLREFGFLLDSRPNVPKNWRKNENFPGWKRQMFALKEKFQGAEWRPNKRVSRQAIDGIRALRQAYPDLKLNEIAAHFKIPPEAVRRILKSKWKPSAEEEAKIQKRWLKRGKKLHQVLHGDAKQKSQDEKALITELSQKPPRIGRPKRRNAGSEPDLGSVMF